MVRQAGQQVILIAGGRLAPRMIDHEVGVRTDRIVRLRELDLNVFDPEG